MPLQGFTSICEQYQTTIVSKDSGQLRKHIADNVNHCWVTQYVIDGVVITSGERCDFLVINENTYAAYLIELKGSDLIHAIEQLKSTEETLRLQLSTYHLKYRIIASKTRTQAIASTTYRKFQASKKEAFICRTSCYRENI